MPLPVHAPDWEEACKSRSFWGDSFDSIPIRLNHRDVTFTAISRARLARIDAYKKRMGWSYEVQASAASDERGVSVFYKNETAEVFHT